MVVFVEGQGNYAIPNNEKQYVHAKIQDGMARITAYEPSSNVVTTYSLTTTQLGQFNMWDGSYIEGLPMSYYKGFDAALWNKLNSKLYLFSKEDFVRIDTSNGLIMDTGYPQPISPIASSLRVPLNFQSDLDAALWNGVDSLVILFKDNELLQVDPTNGTVLSGSQQPIDQFFQDLPTSFGIRIDSAIWSEVNNCVFLFRRGRYVKVNPYNNWTVEPGYPKWINGHWDIAFPKIP